MKVWLEIGELAFGDEFIQEIVERVNITLGQTYLSISLFPISVGMAICNGVNRI